MGEPSKIKKGEIYTHRHYMDSERKPLQCKVTKIDRAVAYYRAYYGKHEDGSDWLGSPYYVELDRFWRSFKEQP
jgi:hypothetical protein